MSGRIAKLPPRYYEMPSRYKDCFYLANSSFFDSVNWYLHKAYEVIFPDLVDKLIRVSGLDEKEASARILNLIEILDQCDNVSDVRFPVKTEDGYFDLIRCFKVRHGSYTGFSPNLMGLRISPDITRDDIKGLGVLSTHRLSAMGIKNLGLFGAIKIESKEYHLEVLKDIIQQYASRCLKEGTVCVHQNSSLSIYNGYFSDGSKDLTIEPDMNCDGTMAGFICNRSGDDGPTDLAASQGAFFGIHHFLNNELIASNLAFPKGISGKTFVIQGFGKMGSNLAVYLQSAGAKCVGVKEENCHVYNKNGLDVNEIISFKKENGDLTGFELAKPVNDSQIYKEDCDILILAAKQKSVLCHFAKYIKAKLIVEAAYHPITPSAYMTLRGHSKIILPDLLICAGSAIAANEEHLREQRETSLSMIHLDDKERFNANRQVLPNDLFRAIEESRMEQYPSTYAVANVVSNKAQELLNTCERYNLGFDFKTAAFTMSIRNIFDRIFSSRQF
ncbi:glutamate dehydrogenase, mitochondrial-like [Coccinella septempunctata]|uniref:glutamate dehydrogenase, mitochondrial-like n=1 Tax=Coccinella septempunctata TaxID=41139 RepID=UPI001D05F01A|nr:glutamate dehydrogenase, mitochondrial-like [Coccinella septempunctata]